jgi:2-C-methyl-D-erythritol 4-phosphate cytidylyltransferase
MGEQKVGVIIVAGGSGKRMGGALPKQFTIVGGEPILARTINTFHKALPASRIVVVLPADQIEFWRNYSSRFSVAKHSMVEGGAERFYSVKNGIEALSEGVDLIAIHDGVRPLASKEMILRAVACAAEHGSAIPVVEVVDSIRTVEGNTSRIVPRSSLRAVQTPQIFSAPTIRVAYDTTFSPAFTDDASVVEAMGERVTLCEGERSNIKITTPEDLTIAEALLESFEERRADE